MICFNKNQYDILKYLILLLFLSLTGCVNNIFTQDAKNIKNLEIPIYKSKPLIAPKGIELPTKNKSFEIPCIKNKNQQKNIHDIFPPI